MSATLALIDRVMTGQSNQPEWMVAEPIRETLKACGCAWCLRLNQLGSQYVIRAYQEYQRLYDECLAPAEHDARATELLERTESRGLWNISGIKLVSREDGSHEPTIMPRWLQDDDWRQDTSRFIRCRGGNCGDWFEPRNPGDQYCPICRGDNYR